MSRSELGTQWGGPNPALLSDGLHIRIHVAMDLLRAGLSAAAAAKPLPTFKGVPFNPAAFSSLVSSFVLPGGPQLGSIGRRVGAFTRTCLEDPPLGTLAAACALGPTAPSWPWRRRAPWTRLTTCTLT